MLNLALLIQNARHIEFSDIEREAQSLGLSVDTFGDGAYGVCWGEDVLLTSNHFDEAERLRLLLAAKVLSERAIEGVGVAAIHWATFEQNVTMTELEDRYWDDLMAAAEHLLEETRFPGGMQA